MNISIFDNSRILITGATGSWGNVLTEMLLKTYNVKEIICFSRGELQQVLMKRKFKDNKVKFIIGDVRDYESLKSAMKGVDIVFHLAALKHVPICEEHPQEAIKTNIIGTTNVINASIENNVKKVIDVSTDKAVDPLNLYGMTKAVGEKLIIQANSLSPNTKFVCIRGGNVLGSNGSVVPLFIEQIQNGGPITITDVRMTRFFLTLNEAISFLFKASEVGVGGETFVMNMPAYYIKDIADVLMQYYGQVEVKEMGIKQGEKLDEVLVSRNESTHTYIYDENYYVILPQNYCLELEHIYGKFEKLPYGEFSSKSSITTKNKISDLLKKGKFL